MGVYLSSPATEKESIDEECKTFCYGASSMQGWRMTQEDAHNCIPDFDPKTNTSFFAVYDGHGGSEVAKYCERHFPDFIKDMIESQGNYDDPKKIIQAAFLAFDATLTQEEVIKELQELAGKDADDEDDDEADDPLGRKETDTLKEEAEMPLEELLAKYGKKESEEPSSSCNDGAGPSSSGSAGSSGSASSSGSSSSSKPAPSAIRALREKGNKSDFLSPALRAKGKSRTQSTDSNDVDPEHQPSSSTSTDFDTPVKSKPGASTSSGALNSQQEPAASSSCQISSSSSSSSNDLSSTVSNGVTMDRECSKKLDASGDAEKEILNNNHEKAKSCSAPDSSSSGGSSGAGGSSSGVGCSSTSSSSASSTIAGGSSRASNGGAGNSNEAQPSNGVSSSGGGNTWNCGLGASGERSSKVKAKEVMALENDLLRSKEKEPGSSDDDEDDDSEEEEMEDMWEDDSEEDDEDDEEEENDEDAPTMDMTGEEPGSDSGCTACVVLLQGSKVIVANAGDSRCVMSRAGEAVELSFDHKPEDDLEKSRIEKAGGKVTGDGRVNGGLNLSRAIGDHVYKRTSSLPAKDQMITALPDIHTADVTNADEFIVIACDGIWNYLSSQETVDYVREKLKDPEKRKNPSKVCEELFDHCLAPNTYGDGTGCDNMTCVIVVFKSWTPDEDEKSSCSDISQSNEVSDAIKEVKHFRKAEDSEEALQKTAEEGQKEATAKRCAENAVSEGPSKKQKVEDP